MVKEIEASSFLMMKEDCGLSATNSHKEHLVK